MEEDIFGDEASFGGIITPGAQGERAPSTPEVAPPPLSLAPLSAAPPLLRPPPPPVAASPPAIPQRAAREVGARGRMWAEGQWGAFRITWVVPRDDAHPRNSAHGDLQALCPFHRRSLTTACKKTVCCRGPTKRDQEVALLRLKLWCNNARMFARQRAHVSNHPTVAEVESQTALLTTLVENQRLDVAPALGTVLTDEELDALDAARRARKRGPPSSAGAETAADASAEGTAAPRTIANANAAEGAEPRSSDSSSETSSSSDSSSDEPSYGT